MSIKVIIKYNDTEGTMSEGQVAMFPSGKKMLSDIIVKVEEKEIVLKTFNLLDKEDNSIITTATYEEGMTWEQFVNSDYNISNNINNNDKFYITENTVKYPYGSGLSGVLQPVYNESIDYTSYESIKKDKIINLEKYYCYYIGSGGSN